MFLRRWAILGIGLLVLLSGVGVAVSSLASSTQEYTVTALQVPEHGSATSPLVFEATIIDELATRDDPAVIALAVTNTGTEPMVLENGPYAPFGVPIADANDTVEPDTFKQQIRALATGGIPQTFHLWRDEYETGNKVTVKNGYASGFGMVQAAATLQPGETITREFQIRAWDRGVDPGHYTVAQNQTAYPAGAGGSSEEWTTVRWQVTFQIEETA